MSNVNEQKSPSFEDVQIGDVFEAPPPAALARILPLDDLKFVIVNKSIIDGLQCLTNRGMVMTIDEEKYEQYIKIDMKLVARNKRVIVSVEN